MTQKKRKKFEEVFGKKKKDVLFQDEKHYLINVYTRYDDWKQLCLIV